MRLRDLCLDAWIKMDLRGMRWEDVDYINAAQHKGLVKWWCLKEKGVRLPVKCRKTSLADFNFRRNDSAPWCQKQVSRFGVLRKKF